MPGPRLLIYLDKLLRLPYRLLLNLFIRTRGNSSPSKDDSVIIIKMMGIGSITRIYRSLYTRNVNLEKTQFVTLATNADLCGLLGVKNTYFIRDKNLITLAWDLIKLSLLIRNKKPKHLINYERGSNILGIFQLLSTAYTRINTVSFHDFDSDIITGRTAIYTIHEKPFQFLINQTIPLYAQREQMDVTRMELVVNTKKVIININASNYMPHRKYPIAGFLKVIKALHDWDPVLSFDLIGSDNEKEYVDSLIRKISNYDITINNRCGQWALSDLVSNLTDCALLITNDSGPMHLGALVRIPMIAIWGPTSAQHFGYQLPNVKNIQTHIGCSPCFLYAKSKGAKACDKRIDCMRDINPDEIFREAKSKLTHLDLFRMVDVAHVKNVEKKSDYNLVS